MELTENDKRIVGMFQELIKRGTDAENLAKSLEEVMWGLARYKLEDNGFTGYDNAFSSLYNLQLLRDVCLGQYRTWPE